jgi:hypothetical protein
MNNNDYAVLNFIKDLNLGSMIISRDETLSDVTVSMHRIDQSLFFASPIA